MLEHDLIENSFSDKSYSTYRNEKYGERNDSVRVVSCERSNWVFNKKVIVPLITRQDVKTHCQNRSVYIIEIKKR